MRFKLFGISYEMSQDTQLGYSFLETVSLCSPGWLELTAICFMFTSSTLGLKESWAITVGWDTVNINSVE